MLINTAVRTRRARGRQSRCPKAVGRDCQLGVKLGDRIASFPMDTIVRGNIHTSNSYLGDHYDSKNG
jgi:hypothetical protein